MPLVTLDKPHLHRFALYARALDNGAHETHLLLVEGRGKNSAAFVHHRTVPEEIPEKDVRQTTGLAEACNQFHLSKLSLERSHQPFPIEKALKVLEAVHALHLHRNGFDVFIRTPVLNTPNLLNLYDYQQASGQASQLCTQKIISLYASRVAQQALSSEKITSEPYGEDLVTVQNLATSEALLNSLNLGCYGVFIGRRDVHMQVRRGCLLRP